MILPISVEIAFTNAVKRDGPNTSDSDCSSISIYMCFKRPDIGYKNTYYILTGTREEVTIQINNLYKEVEKQKKTSHPMADDYNFIETPFESYCNNTCINIHDEPLCEPFEESKCCSHWVSTEFNSFDELEKYMCLIPYSYSYYKKYHIISMNNPETYESLTMASYSLYKYE